MAKQHDKQFKLDAVTIRIPKISEYVDVQRSYSKKAFPWDNACMESFHSM